jgi:hypothetical protein
MRYLSIRCFLPAPSTSSRQVCHTPNPNDMAETDNRLHKLSHTICMVDGIALSIVTIL